MYKGGISLLCGYATGALIGGLSGGIASVKDGKRFIDGASVQKIIREQDIPVIGQRGDNNCVPASIEAVDKSFGGEMTQEQMRSLIGGNPNIDPVEDLSAWSKYVSETGHSLSGEHGITNGSQFRMFSQIGLDNRVVINLNYGGNVGHSVVVQKAILEVATKVNGSISSRVLFYIMDPANGGSIRYINSNSILNAFNIFYIIK